MNDGTSETEPGAEGATDSESEGGGTAEADLPSGRAAGSGSGEDEAGESGSRGSRTADATAARGETADAGRGGESESDAAFDLPSVLSRLDDSDPKTQREAITAVRTTVESDPARCVPTVPKLRSLLGRPSIDFHGRIVYCLAEIADESPDDVAPSTDAIADFAASTPSDRARSDAFRCLANVAERHPDAVVDEVGRIREALEATLDEWGIYLLSRVSRASPEAVRPAKPVLVDALETDPDAYGSTAAATLGRIVSAEPTTSLEFVEHVVALVDHDDPATRNNAIGCLGDVADYNPAAVEDHCPAVAPALECDDPNTRANAAITLARVAAGSPGAVDPIDDAVRERLDDEFAPVRRHACTALGHGGVEAARERLADLAADDPDPGVRDRASWALEQLADD